MDKQAIFFLLSVSLVTLILSFFTAFVYTKVFPVNPRLANGIKIAGVVFPFLYVLANALSRYSDIAFIKWLYTGMSIGAGIAFYFLLGAVVLVIILFFYKIFGKNVPTFFPWLVLLTSLGLSALGFAQSKIFQVVNHDIYIENLPQNWENSTAVLFSDTHYGLVNHKKAAARLVSKIIDEKPDMVLMAGDLFDGPSVETESLSKEWLRLTTKFPVFYAPGNHEEYGNYEKFVNSAREGGFIVLEDEKNIYDGVQILGLKYRSKNKEVEVAELLQSQNISKDIPLIVISHPPIFQNTLNNAGADLMVSGHTHRGQFWPLRYVTKMIYGVYHYGLNDYKNLQVLTTSGVGTAGPPLRLFNTPEIVKITFKKK